MPAFIFQFGFEDGAVELLGVGDERFVAFGGDRGDDLRVLGALTDE